MLLAARDRPQVVTGATGRVGQLAVRRILELYPKVLVRAVVNDFSKGTRLLQEEKNKYGVKLEVSYAGSGSCPVTGYQFPVTSYSIAEKNNFGDR